MSKQLLVQPQVMYRRRHFCSQMTRTSFVDLVIPIPFEGLVCIKASKDFKWLSYSSSVHSVFTSRLTIDYPTNGTSPTIDAVAGRSFWSWSARPFCAVSSPTRLPRKLSVPSRHGTPTNPKSPWVFLLSPATTFKLPGCTRGQPHSSAPEYRHILPKPGHPSPGHAPSDAWVVSHLVLQDLTLVFH